MTSPPAATGVDVGGTKILAVAFACGDGRPAREARVPTPRGFETLIDAIVAAVHEVGGPGPAVGVGLPGLVDRRGVLRMGPNLPGVVDAPFRSALTERFGVDVVVDNDANCAAFGEYRMGAARGHDDAVLVTLGTGIGGGLITNGRLQRGAGGFAAEVGHMVVDPNGPPCPCGKKGCWERFASGTGLGRLARQAAEAGRLEAVLDAAGGDADAVRGEHVTAAAAAGDPDAVAVIDALGWWVALGVANLVAVLDPSIVVVGGGLVEAGDILLDPVRRHLRELVVAQEHRPEVALAAAQLGESAGAIGAALLADEDGTGPS